VIAQADLDGTKDVKINGPIDHFLTVESAYLCFWARSSDTVSA
jgi:hypothetical protein